VAAQSDIVHELKETPPAPIIQVSGNRHMHILVLPIFPFSFLFFAPWGGGGEEDGCLRPSRFCQALVSL
jgi:hypothetical protein